MEVNNTTIIYKERNWSIHKNPETLSGFGPDVRGVIDEAGDLYMESESNGTIHIHILRILYELKVLKGRYKGGWSRKTPDLTGFLTVQRVRDTPVMAIGESNRPLYKTADHNEKMHLYTPFLEKAGKNNPGMRFINKLVWIKPPFRGDSSLVTVNDEDIIRIMKK